MKGESQNTVEGKWVKKDDEVPLLSDSTKFVGWKDLYRHLLDIWFSWDAPILQNTPAVEETPALIS